jgi:O-methyltransferase involved in polyketide biosynthesis
MTKPWWAGTMRHSLASLLGCARARERFPDLDFADRAAEALVERVGLRAGMFRDEELKPLVLVAMTLDVVLEQRLAQRPGLTVVHLGGGLSTRPLRLRGLARRWIDVEEPAAAEMKRELWGEWPGYSLVDCEPGDTRWVDALAEAPERRLLLVSESGLLEASPGDFHAVLDAVAHRLPRGTELLFAHDRRHPIRAEEGASLLIERATEQGERLQIRYPRLRLVSRGAHDEDVWMALEGIEALHALHGGRLPRITHVALA